MALRVWGDFAQRQRAAVLFRILVQLIARYRRPTLSRQSPEVPTPSGLRLPRGYVAGSSKETSTLHQLLVTLAQGDLPVLVVGETGTGKEYVAHILHASSPRRDGPFVALNCAAMPTELLEAELFGIAKGVATGVSARQGQFQQAAGGTLFLDEIGELPLSLQPKLLRVLQEKVVQPVGGSPRPLEVRLLAATNQALDQHIHAGKFRADLYYRLAGALIQVPALRQRREDVAALVEHFLRRTCEQLHKPIRGLSVRALEVLAAQSWPGNVRQLENEVQRLVYTCPAGGVIESSMIAPAVLNSDQRAGRLPEMVRQISELRWERIERAVVEEALRRTRGNQVQAGKLLGISRTAVRRHLARWSDEE